MWRRLDRCNRDPSIAASSEALEQQDPDLASQTIDYGADVKGKGKEVLEWEYCKSY